MHEARLFTSVKLYVFTGPAVQDLHDGRAQKAEVLFCAELYAAVNCQGLGFTDVNTKAWHKILLEAGDTVMLCLWPALACDVCRRCGSNVV